MSSDQRWKWAGIVSVISVGGVLLTDIVANVVGGYISDQIKTWQVPIQQAPTPAAKATVASVPTATLPQPAPQATMAAVAPKPLHRRLKRWWPWSRCLRLSPSQSRNRKIWAAPAPTPMPLPPRPMELSGTVEQVIDTGTLKIQGETIALGGIKGLGSPYRDQFAKFIEEQGSQIRCTPTGDRYHLLRQQRRSCARGPDQWSGASCSRCNAAIPAG